MAFRVIMAAAALAAAGGAAQAASLTNGGFETNGANFSGSFINVGSGSPILTGWTVGGGDLDLINAYWQPDEGRYSLDLNGQSAATIWQDVSGLTIGTSYTVSFALAGNPAGGPSQKALRVSAGGASQDYGFDISGRTLSDMGWTGQTFSFVAGATTERLSFASLIGGAYGPALDDVSLSAAVSAVPAPPALALAATALAALGAVGRRRRA